MRWLCRYKQMSKYIYLKVIRYIILYKIETDLNIFEIDMITSKFFTTVWVRAACSMNLRCKYTGSIFRYIFILWEHGFVTCVELEEH